MLLINTCIFFRSFSVYHCRAFDVFLQLISQSKHNQISWHHCTGDFLEYEALFQPTLLIQ